MNRMIRNDNGEIVYIDISLWLRSIYNNPITDLGKIGGQALSGIYSPIYDQQEITRFITSKYSSDEGANSSHEKLIGFHDYYQRLISEAMEITSFDTKRPLTILELGCGSGSATIPILRIFPNAWLIATELSIPMLTILNQELLNSNYPRNHMLMQLNAENLDFHPGTFDLIIGSAILHHLYTPEKTIGKCWELLKPVGILLFFEPFESGFSILSLIYKEIIRENRNRIRFKLNKVGIRYLNNCIYVWGKMRNQDKTDPFFTGVDDKWAFTKPYFDRIAQNYHFDKLIIYPLDKSSRPFENLVKAHSIGNNVEFPQWVWAIVGQFEENFSVDMKTDLLTEGAVIFIK